VDSVVVGPSLWTRAAENPTRTARTIVDLLGLIHEADVRPCLTEELKEAITYSPEVQTLLATFRDDRFARQGVAGDLLVLRLFDLLNGAPILENPCIWDGITEVSDSSRESSESTDVYEAFLACLAVATIRYDGVVSKHAISGPVGSRIRGAATQIYCPGEDLDSIPFDFSVAEDKRSWLEKHVGALRTANANVSAALARTVPERQWRVHTAFEDSVRALPDTRPGRLREVYRACAIAIERDPSALARHGDERLDRVAPRADGAEARRLRIVNVGPAAPRLHYWLGTGYVELCVAVRHDEYQIPD